MNENDRPASEETAPEVDAVIVVPIEAESPGPSLEGRVSAIEARLTDLAVSLSAHIAAHEDTNGDTPEDVSETGDGTGDDGDVEETGPAEERDERPVTRHWLFGKRW